MEQSGSPSQTGSKSPQGPTRKRTMSGTSSLLSRIPFLRSRTSAENARRRHSVDDSEKPSVVHDTLSDAPAVAAALLHPQAQEEVPAQQRPRRRRGSLRKVVLLGRGAQRERRAVSIDTTPVDDRASEKVVVASAPPLAETNGNIPTGLGLAISDITPRPSMEGFASRSSVVWNSEDATPTTATAPALALQTQDGSLHGGDDSTYTSPTISYSTTDDEDGLHMTNLTTQLEMASADSSSVSLLRPQSASLSSGSDSYFAATTYPRPMGLDSMGGTSLTMTKCHGSVGIGGGSPAAMASIQRRRSVTAQRAKSPLALTSLSGLTSTPLPAPDLADWDYAETEFWGWVVLVVTWVVFVTGMGSCLGVWSWAWDVGTTPSAPPELSNDNSLPIVGYYPALMILTSVMAWVWVVVAWVGMKYFRHARVTGD